MGVRLQLLRDWLDQVLDGRGYSLEPASGDASFRRYFRVTPHDGSATLIAMDAPPPREDCAPFVRVARELARIGVHVPRIHAESLRQGLLLLDDLGSTHYLDRLDADCADRLYGDALGTLAVMQACADPQGLPPYSEQLLRQEMALYRDWLLGHHLGYRPQGDEDQALSAVEDLLVANALEQPQVFVHRDYHSRNLLLTPNHNPGVLDFQDAVLGPVTYDLVSLLKDCYITWPRERVKDWVMGYFDLACQSGILRRDSEGSFLRWFDLMGVQRHLKASGIFARLWHRDGKPGYLKDIPRTLAYITQLGVDYPLLEPLTRQIESRVLPELDRQA